MTDPLHIQLAARPTVDDWQPDCVMDGYQQATIHLGHDDEGDIVATFDGGVSGSRCAGTGSR